MRLIDADALQLAIVEEGQANKRKKYIIGDIWELTGAEIRDVINSQPTIQPEPHWIPVEQALPEKSGEYLVTVKWVTGDCDVDVYEYDARHKTWNDGESAGGERAVAWMPLPEPYKEVTE